MKKMKTQYNVLKKEADRMLPGPHLDCRDENLSRSFFSERRK